MDEKCIHSKDPWSENIEFERKYFYKKEKKDFLNERKKEGENIF